MKLLPGFVLRRFGPVTFRGSSRVGTVRLRTIHGHIGPSPALPPLTSRTRWQRHHLRAALWFFLAFVAAQLMLGAWIDRTPEIRDPEYALLRDRLRDRIAARPGAPVAVFLGSSRVAYGFDPLSGGGAEVLFNFGVPGSGPYLVDVMRDRLSADGVRPDALFVELMPAFYNATDVRALDYSLLDGARLTAGELSGLFTYTSRPTGPLRRWAYGRFLPIHRHQAELRERTGLDTPSEGVAAEGPQIEIDAAGFRPRSCTLEQRAEMTAIAHKQYDPFYADFHMAEKPVVRLERTIRRARSDGAMVVLVLMPEGTEFRNRYTLAAAAGVANLMQRLRDETGVPIVDARDWLSDQAFYDQHHLNPSGAAAFTARFQREILPLAFRGR